MSDNATDVTSGPALDTGVVNATAVAPRQRRSVNRPRQRNLVRWGPDKDQLFLLALEWASNEEGISLPWDKAAAIIEDFCTGEAVKQHLSKLYAARVANGLKVPPKSERKGRKQKLIVNEGSGKKTSIRAQISKSKGGNTTAVDEVVVPKPRVKGASLLVSSPSTPSKKRAIPRKPRAVGTRRRVKKEDSDTPSPEKIATAEASESDSDWVATQSKSQSAKKRGRKSDSAVKKEIMTDNTDDESPIKKQKVEDGIRINRSRVNYKEDPLSGEDSDEDGDYEEDDLLPKEADAGDLMEQDEDEYDEEDLHATTTTPNIGNIPHYSQVAQTPTSVRSAKGNSSVTGSTQTISPAPAQQLRRTQSASMAVASDLEDPFFDNQQVQHAASFSSAYPSANNFGYPGVQAGTMGGIIGYGHPQIHVGMPVTPQQWREQMAPWQELMAGTHVGPGVQHYGTPQTPVYYAGNSSVYHTPVMSPRTVPSYTSYTPVAVTPAHHNSVYDYTVFPSDAPNQTSTPGHTTPGLGITRTDTNASDSRNNSLPSSDQSTTIQPSSPMADTQDNLTESEGAFTGQSDMFDMMNMSDDDDAGDGKVDTDMHDGMMDMHDLLNGEAGEDRPGPWMA
ncbi:hypothetical protein LTR28_005420 [Elasticomyces elasticus]|nr:hypothetical protein LTR28_005420 [Elasticomyces elasticus]